MKRLLFTAVLAALVQLVCWQWAPRATSAPTNANKLKASADLAAKVTSGHGGDMVRVIVQRTAAWDSAAESELQNAGGINDHQFQNFPLRIITLPAQAALALSTRSDVAYVSVNREVRTLGHVSLTTGADAVRAANGVTVSGLDGTGIGIAVLDSGIDPTHTAFVDRSNQSRILASVDFTLEGRTDDPYGHGTHVASIAAGNGRISRTHYLGIAPIRSIVNLRVLHSQRARTRR